MEEDEKYSLPSLGERQNCKEGILALYIF